MDGNTMDRRTFARLAAVGALSAGAVLGGCASQPAASGSADADADSANDKEDVDKIVYSYDPLPDASPDPNSPFGVDSNINIQTIDNFLDRPDVAYRDMRMLKDPAHYEEMGGDSSLSVTLPGFRIMPLPYLATVPALPISGAYDGDRLFDVDWGDSLAVQNVTPRYKEADQILEDVFPKDKALFLMCGGGGYAAATRALLVAKGWDASRIYNVGGAWDYTGFNPVEIMHANSDGSVSSYLWRADSVTVDFSQLTSL